MHEINARSVNDNSTEAGRVYTILDVIGDHFEIREEIMAEVEKRLALGQHVEEYTELLRFAEVLRAVDEIEIVEQKIYRPTWEDRLKSLEVTRELGRKAEDRVKKILLQFEIVEDVEYASMELDQDGVDLIIHFNTKAGLEDTGVQVKSSKAGVQQFVDEHDLEDLIERYHLIIINANPSRKDSDIYLQLDKIFSKRLAKTAHALTNAS